MHHRLFSLFALLPSTHLVFGQVTVYGQIPLAQTATSGAALPTLAAYDRTSLIPPALPSPMPATAYTLNLQKNAAQVSGLSIPHVGGGFWGFSIEMSVVSQVLGKNSSFIQVPFLNLMSNLVERSGGVVIRIGGNTQESAALIDSLPQGRTFSKVDATVGIGTTKTPSVVYTKDMFYMANNISSMVNVKWFFGIPFNQTTPWRLSIAEEAQSILGSNLLGLQAGNEPDFYQQFGRRTTYSPELYCEDVKSLIDTINGDSLIPNKNMLIGPSVSSIIWTPELVWDAGFIDRFKGNLYALSVEHYPNNNCVAQFGTNGTAVVPQDVFASYLSHDAAISLVQPYINSANLAQRANLPLIMFETNTAACGGFAGVSDSYGAALWALDYGFQAAAGNFTHGLLHIGGQNAYYNPFTSPPTNQSSYNQWTVGAIYYATIVLAEALGKTNTSQIIDLLGNNAASSTPSYAIYENKVLSKVVLFNYMDDPTGKSGLNVTLSIPGGAPATVTVKYLLANSVSSKDDITWAGQTLGNQREVDGRFKGTFNATTINCQAAAGTCSIPVPAPGFALVFLDNTDPMLSVAQATQTFTTSAYTRTRNTVTYDPSALHTSNGFNEKLRLQLGSTSPGGVAKKSSARGRQRAVGVLGRALGVVWVLKNLV